MLLLLIIIIKIVKYVTDLLVYNSDDDMSRKINVLINICSSSNIQLPLIVNRSAFIFYK